MALAGALEQAAGTIARLDAALASHPLRPAWVWRARLDAIGRQAAVDGKAIDPWHLAALIEGVRLRLDHTPVLIDRGMLFAAAHHAFELYRWFAVPDETQRAAIRLAADHLVETVGTAQSPLLGAALGVHAWLDRGGERPPLRAALALYWQRRQVTALPCPLLTGAAALGADIPWAGDDWIEHFLGALAGEAEDGLALLALLERQWFAARACGRRPAPRFACRRGDRHPGRGPAGLCHHARASARYRHQQRHPAARRVCRARDCQRSLAAREAPALWAQTPGAVARSDRTTPPSAARAPPRPAECRLGGCRCQRRGCRYRGSLVPSPPLLPFERQKFDFGDIDHWLDLTDQAIRRAQRVLDAQSTRSSARVDRFRHLRSLAVGANEIAILG